MPVASFLGLLLAIAPPAPVPAAPVVASAVVAPPIISMGERGPRTTETFTVQVRQDDRLLWSGELMRASDGMASFSQQTRESRACTEGEPSYGGRSNLIQNSSLSVSINPNYPYGEGMVRVSVERTRPYGSAATICGGEEGTSTVRFESRAQLPAGKPVTLRGEGGLSVTIARR